MVLAWHWGDFFIGFICCVFSFPFSVFTFPFVSLFLHHLCRMDFAHLPYLVADGEESDGYNKEDGEEEVEEYHHPVLALYAIQGKSSKYDDEGNGENADNDSTDEKQAQVIPAEQTHDVPRVGTMNLAQSHFLLSAT